MRYISSAYSIYPVQVFTTVEGESKLVKMAGDRVDARIDAAGPQQPAASVEFFLFLTMGAPYREMGHAQFIFPGIKCPSLGKIWDSGS